MDRNEITITDIDFRIMSLSARRAWIEIVWVTVVIVIVSGRSPQGERG